jgi:hypothetical protein
VQGGVGAVSTGIDACACDETAQAPTPTLSNATTNSLTLNWSAFPGATNYLLRMSTSGDAGTFNDLLGLNVYLPGGAITSYTVTGLQEGTQYWFKLLAYNNDVVPQYRTALSNDATGATLLRAPVATLSAVGERDLRVTWTNASPAATEFQVRRTPTTNLGAWNESSPGNPVTDIVPTPQSSFLYTSNTTYPASDYRVRVVAVRRVGGVVVSASVPLAQLANWPVPNVGDVQGSTAPLPLVSGANIALVNRSTTAITINWPGASAYAGGHLRYQAQRNTNPLATTGWVDGYVNPNPSGDLSQQFTGLTAGTRYYFRVRSWWAPDPDGATSTTAPVQGGVGAVSTGIDACACDETAQAPTPAVIGANANGLTIGWSAVSGATNYQLLMSFTGQIGSFNNVLGAELDLPGGAVTSYTLTGLQEGTQYWFRLLAYNRAVEPNYRTALSDISSGWTRLVAPSGVLASAVPGSNVGLRVTWTDNSNGETRYRVERTEATSPTTWTGLTYVTGTLGTGTVMVYDYPSGIWPSTDFSVRVTAERIEGAVVVDSSSTVVGTGVSVDLPLATNLRLTARTSTSATLAWDGPVNFAGGYMRWVAQVSQTGANGTWVWGNDVPLPETDRNQQFNGLTPRTATNRYYFRVRSWWHNVPFAPNQVITVGGGFSVVFREP